MNGPEGTMNHMAGRKKHSAEDVVRKLRRADELAAAGKTNEEIAARLDYSDAANFRHAFARWTGKNPSAFRTAGKARTGALNACGLVPK